VKKVLVIGESCRDVFVYCKAARLCPDVPVPVLNILDTAENAGMAKNVQRNILSLMPECDILTNNNWTQIAKTRYVDEQSNHMFFRVDSTHDIDRIDIHSLNLEYELIVISDYNKGFLHSEDIEYICSRHDNVFLDTKKVLGQWANNSRYIKINDFEYKNSQQFITNPLRKKIIHTQGSKGCEFRGKNYPVKKVDVKDSSGAGDTFMAALVVAYLSSGDIEHSVIEANRCASEVVKKRGVSTI